MVAGYGWQWRLVFKPPAAEAGVGGAVASLLRPARKQHSPGAGEDRHHNLAVAAGDAHQGGPGAGGCLMARVESCLR
jgi:hypothetical protein